MTGGAARRLPLKPVALPNEHGVWGFVLEPALLGLVLAPTLAGLALVAAALGALLAQHPLSLVLADRRRGKVFPRTRLARRFALLYGLAAAAGLALALLWAPDARFLVPLALVSPLVAVQLVYDARNRGRAALPEQLGALALAALAPSLLLLGGWSAGSALLIWLLLALRNAPSIHYVRTRVRLERGQAVPTWPAVASNVAAFALLAALALSGWLPPLALLPFGVLLARALHGLSPLRGPLAAKQIGFRELAYGLLTVAVLALALG